MTELATARAVGSGGARLESIDCLRGVAALAVVFLHAMLHSQPPTEGAPWLGALQETARRGGLGVMLFFLVSGFCIHLRWARRRSEGGTESVTFLAFWKRRLHRLYPPYFVVLCLSMLLVLGVYLLDRSWAIVELYPEPKLRWMGLDFLAHAFMLHGLHPVFDAAGGNPPMWTLAREEYFYLLYLPLLAARRRLGLPATFAGVAAIGVLFPILLRPVLPAESAYWYVVNSSALVLWYQWCLGMVAVESYFGLVRLPSALGSFWAVPGWAALAVAAESWSTLQVGAFRLEMVFWPLAFLALINGCVALERQRRWPDHPLVRWLGRVGVFSYSLYLVHLPVIMIAQAFLPTGATRNPWVYLVNVVVLMLVALVAGRLFFHLVERRFLNTAPDSGRNPLADRAVEGLPVTPSAPTGTQWIADS